VEDRSSPDIRAAKRTLREYVRRLRSSLTREESDVSSEAIWRRVQELPLWHDARTIHTYVGALPGEVRTDALIAWSLEHGRRVIVPVADRKRRELHHVQLGNLEDLRPTSWGGLEPIHGTHVEPNVADLVIVPGIAFDRDGRRLGMGGGYYDRFLASVRVPTVALAHAFQIVDLVPADQRDARVSLIVTPDEVIVPA